MAQIQPANGYIGVQDPPIPSPPTQILHDHCLQFLLGITVVPGEIEDNKTMVMQFFGGRVEGEGRWKVNKVHCGLCENGELLSFCFSCQFCHSRKIFKDHVVITRVGIGVAFKINFLFRHFQASENG